MSTSRKLWTDGAALVLVLAALVSTAMAIRPLDLAILFLAAAIVPGATVMTRLDVLEAVTEAGLIVGLSLAIDVIVSLALIWSGWWHPAVVVGGVAAIASTLLMLDVRRRWIARGDS